jgi:hypothetical protein
MCSFPEDRVSPAVAKSWADVPSVQGAILRIAKALWWVNKQAVMMKFVGSCLVSIR